MKIKNACERDCKPSSVEDDHLSRPGVAAQARAISGTQRATDSPYPSCTGWGLHHGRVTRPWVSSYLAFPSLPDQVRRYLSVALSLESPPPAVSRHPALRCSDFPHAFLRHAIAWSPHMQRNYTFPNGSCQAEITESEAGVCKVERHGIDKDGKNAMI